jgi:hypothetical protein
VNTGRLAAHLVAVALLAATTLALALSGDVRFIDDPGLRLDLPDRLGAWTGDELRFCQAAGCQHAGTVSELGSRDECPRCGGKLGPLSAVEASLLPADTAAVKKQYRDGKGGHVFVSIVLSGRERSSIHRPELCLIGPGTELAGSAVLKVDIPGRAPMGVTVLDLVHRAPGQAPGAGAGSYFAYWFAGRGRETPRHLVRMFWMALDRVVFNTAYPWAYIAVAGNRDPGGRHLDQVREFVALLQPAIAPKL